MDRQLQHESYVSGEFRNFSRINVDRQLQQEDYHRLIELNFSRINVDRQLQRWIPCHQPTRHFSRINVDRQLQRKGLSYAFVGNFSRINVDRQLQHVREVVQRCDDFSRINVDRQLQRSGGRHAARVDFSRITMDRQRQQTACPQKRTRADREPSLPARFQHCAGQTPVCPAVRFFVFRMLEDAAEVGHVKHDHGQQTAEYAQRQARLGHVAGCYHAGGIGKGIGRITDGQTHAQ